MTLIRALHVALVVVLLAMAATALSIIDIQPGRYRIAYANPDPALVQTEYGVAYYHPDSVSATYNVTPVAGDLLVAIVGVGYGSTVANQPSGWSTAINQQGMPGQAIFYKIAGSSESKTVTVALSYNGADVVVLQIYEYSGIATTSPLDQTGSATGYSASPSSGSVTTTQANELLIVGSMIEAVDSYSGWTNSFTEEFDQAFAYMSGWTCAGADRIVTATGTYSTTATTTASYPWIGQIATFKAAAAPTATPTPTNTPTPTASPTPWATPTPSPTPTPTPRLYVVNSIGDGGDSSPGDKICNDGSGHCTLRAAMMEANADGDPSTINFNIGGGGVQTITPGSVLPAITQPVTIDGTTQPGYAGAPIIELNGASAGTANALAISAGGSTVSGLVINRFAGDGVQLGTGGGNVISGNYIGTNVAGTVAQANANGVLIQSSGNIIGGTTAGARNVISGNNGNGVLIIGATATGNVVEGNFIGTTATGTVALGNHFAGVGALNDASNTTVGGTAPGAGNVISGNGTTGVGTAGGAGTGLVVQGNFIGTDPSGTLALGNGGDGVGLASESNCTVGGTASGARNTIAHNGGNGVSVNTVNNAVRGNSIFANTGLGIDLAPPNGVTQNDVGDVDTGPNNLQNFPVLNLAVTGSTSIQGSLNSTPSTQFVLHFYSNASCDPSGYGEGESFLGSTTVTTNGGGNASFSAAFPQTVPSGRFITATATDPGGNTSEFSACIQVASGPIPTPTPTPVPVINRLAGTAGKFDFRGDGGPARDAWLNAPHGSFEVTSSHTLYFADTGNNRVRRIYPNQPTGIVTTVAGGGSCTPPNVGDGGLATSACLDHPYDVFVDGPGNLYIADTGNNRVRKVSTAGIITTVAGGGPSCAEPCPATQQALNGPRGVAVDASGNIFIADTENHRIRRVDAASGIITTVAGDGIAGFSGDGVPATATHLNRPHDVYMYGTSGDFLIADTLNNRIRRVDGFTGVILTFAGSGLASFGGDGGPAVLAHLNGPEAVAVDSSDLRLPNVLIADTQNHRIRRVNGHTSVISTVAGNGTPGSGGDGGDPTSAQLYLPAGIAVGSLTGSDTGNSTLRAIDPTTGEPGGRFSGFSCTVGSVATADWVLVGFVLGLILARRQIRGLILWIRAAAAPAARRERQARARGSQ